MRYPGWQASRGVRSFPFVGECAPMEYWFMTIDLAGVLAIVTFVYARKIEFCGDQ